MSWQLKNNYQGNPFKNLSKYRNLSEFHTLNIQDPDISAKNAFEEMDFNFYVNLVEEISVPSTDSEGYVEFQVLLVTRDSKNS